MQTSNTLNKKPTNLWAHILGYSAMQFASAPGPMHRLL